MAKLRIVMIDVESGHTVKTIERSWGDTNATDAADDVETTLDTFSDCEELDD